MGLIQKKEEERELVDGIEVIERSDVPNDLPEPEVELAEGRSAQDMAREPEPEPEPETEPDPELLDSEPPTSQGVDDGGSGCQGACPRKGMAIAVVVILVVVAAIGGYFFGRGGFGPKGAGTAKLTDDQLDAVVATWSYNGGTHDLTAREAIEAQYSLDVAKNSDGTYNAPATELVVGYIRNQLLLDEAKARGIEVDDDELGEFANNKLGSSDFAALASQYGVSEEQAKQIVRENAIVSELYAQIAPELEANMPEAPSEPADGDANAVTKEYADYIIKLAGKDWDAQKGEWANPESPYAQALGGSATFSAEGASYADAQAAYFVAYQQYAQDSQGSQQAWSDFMNGLYAQANVTLYGIYL